MSTDGCIAWSATLLMKPTLIACMFNREERGRSRQQIPRLGTYGIRRASKNYTVTGLQRLVHYRVRLWYILGTWPTHAGSDLFLPPAAKAKVALRVALGAGYIHFLALTPKYPGTLCVLRSLTCLSLQPGRPACLDLADFRGRHPAFFRTNKTKQPKPDQSANRALTHFRPVRYYHCAEDILSFSAPASPSETRLPSGRQCP